MDIKKSLEESGNAPKVPLQIGNTYYSVEKFPLIFRDGSSSKVIFLIPAAIEQDIFKNFIITVLLTFFICFIAMSIIIPYIF